MKKLIFLSLSLLLLLILIPGCFSLPAPTILPVATPSIIGTFSTNPSTINSGGISTLLWNVTGATTVNIDQGIGLVDVAGSRTISPSVSTVYTITAINSAGTVTGSTTTTVNPVLPTQPAIIEFSNNPSTINPGGTSTLLWNVSGATSVSIDQGVGLVGVAGSRIVSPAVSTIYTITASNSAGIVTRSTIITVNSALPTPPQIIKGVTIITLSTISNESGSIVDSLSQGTGESIYTTTKGTACIGDDSNNSESRAFLSFDISAIPQNAVIKEAILDLSSFTKIGNPTYETVYGGTGDLKVYHHQYGALSDTNTITSSIWWNSTAKLTENGSFTNYLILPLKWDVKNSEAGEPVIQTLVQTGQTRSQFMIQFYSSTDWDSVADKLCFSNVTLTIKYTMP